MGICVCDVGLILNYNTVIENISTKDADCCFCVELKCLEIEMSGFKISTV